LPHVYLQEPSPPLLRCTFQDAAAIYTSQMVFELGDTGRLNGPSLMKASSRTLDFALFRVEGYLMVRRTLRPAIAMESLDASSVYSRGKVDGKGCAIEHGATELLEYGSEAIRSRRAALSKRSTIVV
jgi:hypothetical protein